MYLATKIDKKNKKDDLSKIFAFISIFYYLIT